MSNVVISCFTPGAVFDRAAEGLLGEAERHARALSTEHIVLAGAADDEVLQSCARHANLVVAVLDEEYGEYQPESCLAILHAACAGFQPRAVLLSQDTYSQELAPRLAHRLQGCSIGDAQRIGVCDDCIRVTRSVYGGKAIAVVQANAVPAVVWLRAPAFGPEPERADAGQIEARRFLTEDCQPSTLNATKIVERHREASSGVRLEDAQVIVSGGRGLGGPEPFEALRELAAAIDAQVAASRAACDSGWVPPGLQVGQTGKKVAPELYIAIAISGASQHLMGISDAKVVAAINTDADAPIFRRCQFGLVEDWKKVVGPLTERLKASKNV